MGLPETVSRHEGRAVRSVYTNAKVKPAESP